MATFRKRTKGVKTGWTIIDKWAAKGRNANEAGKSRTGMRWMAGAWDPHRRKDGIPKPGYDYKGFPDDAEGYQAARAWAESRAASFKQKVATSTKFLFSDVGATYIAHLDEVKQVSKRHLDQVSQCVRLGCQVGLGDILDDKFAANVERWLSHMKTSHGDLASASLRNKFLGFIKSICSHARKRLGAPSNPMDVVDPFQQAKPLKMAYTLQELRALLNPSLCDHELYVYIALMVYMGFRPSECLHLELTDFDFANSTVRLRYDVKGNKKKREAIVPLQPELKDILVRLVLPNRSSLVPERYRSAARADAVLRAIKGYIKKEGVNPPRMFRHAFRNTFASLHAAIGTNFASVLSMLNHNDVAVSSAYQSLGITFHVEVANWPKDQSFYILRRLGDKNAG